MFAVDIGVSCFGWVCIEQVRIKTNFRSISLENLAFSESNSPDFSQLCILQHGEMASGKNKTQVICFSAVTAMSLMQMYPIPWHLKVTETFLDSTCEKCHSRGKEERNGESRNWKGLKAREKVEKGYLQLVEDKAENKRREEFPMARFGGIGSSSQRE